MQNSISQNCFWDIFTVTLLRFPRALKTVALIDTEPYEEALETFHFPVLQNEAIPDKDFECIKQ